MLCGNVYRTNSFCSHLAASLILLRAIITKTPLTCPTPRTSKFIGNLLNISSWVYHENLRTPDEQTKYLDHVFDNYDYDTKDDYVCTLAEFRKKKMYFPNKSKDDEETDDDKKEDVSDDNDMLMDDELIEVDEEKVNNVVEFKFKFLE